MVNDAEATARNAEADRVNDPGYCLQQTRIWAGIPSLYPDAATAWRHTVNPHPGDRNPPRGAAVYWTGGSKGYGHIGTSLGDRWVRSTDAGGAGHIATVALSWVEDNWGLPYAGWAWDINRVTIPHQEEDELNADDWERMEKLIESVWAAKMEVTKPDGSKTDLAREQVLRETYQEVKREL